jgi:ribonuclease J
LIEIIELANKYRRKIIFYNEEQRKTLKMAEKLGYYHIPVGLELPNTIENTQLDNVVIIVAGSGAQLFKQMLKIALKEDEKLELRQKDTVIIASPIVPGTEKEAAKMENEIYKEDVKVVTLDRRKVFSMHASSEDIKMMMYLFKPKYFIPVKGEYRHLIANANIALDMGWKANRIVLLDNGQIARFVNGECVDVSEILQLEDVMVAGKDNLDLSGMVLRDRETLATDGAIVVGVVVDFRTKKIIGGPDVQSRGVIYLKDADYIVKEIGNIMERTIEEAVAEYRYDNLQVRSEVREKISRYVAKETGKRPMILPAIVEINL